MKCPEIALAQAVVCLVEMMYVLHVLWRGLKSMKVLLSVGALLLIAIVPTQQLMRWLLKGCLRRCMEAISQVQWVWRPAGSFSHMLLMNSYIWLDWSGLVDPVSEHLWSDLDGRETPVLLLCGPVYRRTQGNRPHCCVAAWPAAPHAVL